MTRTFQINTLFPGLTVLESVVLAICERKGRARRLASRRVAQQREAVRRGAGAARIAAASTRDADTRHAQPALRQAAAGRDRAGAGDAAEDAAARRAGGRHSRRARARELFGVIAALPRDVTILFIEHDMELVFRFAERITVLVGGAVLTEGTPAEIAADARVQARSIWARAPHG